MKPLHMQKRDWAAIAVTIVVFAIVIVLRVIV
jgi:energy-coupling factor transporter transmembrane protein EcfT